MPPGSVIETHEHKGGFQRVVKHYSRSHDAVTRVYDDAGNEIETHEGAHKQL
jgi:hypothetical protein